MEEIELIEDEIFKRMELIKYCENKINVLNSSCEINKICDSIIKHNFLNSQVYSFTLTKKDKILTQI
jgi:hypothetical protein